ncbi:MAG: hypothetical protein JWL94_962 [Microbacteriaceae bacterium]|jgi:hypothetical protein|nr:hypothetical protein [Microbacteriaceae bacterium]HEV7957783.1 hypothetical protein [Marisediminicola sp.]
MATGGGEERASRLARRLAIRWPLAAIVVLIAFAGTIAALNSTLYSAQGFVGSYLAALDRGDVDAAVGTPGVRVPEDAAADLLSPAALGKLDDIRLVSESDEGAGVHLVEYEFKLDGATGRTAFEIEHLPNRFGLFQAWSFVTSPSGILEVTAENTTTFDANGIAVESSAGPSVSASYAVLTPGAFSLGHDSELLSAQPETVLVVTPGETVQAHVSARANEDFEALVQGELDGLLDGCTDQTVLHPTGCPFGETITNRLEGVPEWSMVEYPDVEIIPGPTPGTWQVPPTVGTAHLVVGVRSLFDGSLSTFDEDVQFSVSYLITIEPGGRVDIIGQ